MPKSNRSQLAGPSIVWQTALNGRRVHACATLDGPDIEAVLFDLGYMRRHRTTGQPQFVACPRYEAEATDADLARITEEFVAKAAVIASRAAPALAQSGDPVKQALAALITAANASGKFPPGDLEVESIERVPHP